MFSRKRGSDPTPIDELKKEVRAKCQNATGAPVDVATKEELRHALATNSLPTSCAFRATARANKQTGYYTFAQGHILFSFADTFPEEELRQRLKVAGYRWNEQVAPFLWRAPETPDAQNAAAALASIPWEPKRQTKLAKTAAGYKGTRAKLAQTVPNDGEAINLPVSSTPSGPRPLPTTDTPGNVFPPGWTKKDEEAYTEYAAFQLSKGDEPGTREWVDEVATSGTPEPPAELIKRSLLSQTDYKGKYSLPQPGTTTNQTTTTTTTPEGASANAMPDTTAEEAEKLARELLAEITDENKPASSINASGNSTAAPIAPENDADTYTASNAAGIFTITRADLQIDAGDPPTPPAAVDMANASEAETAAYADAVSAFRIAKARHTALLIAREDAKKYFAELDAKKANAEAARAKLTAARENHPLASVPEAIKTLDPHFVTPAGLNAMLDANVKRATEGKQPDVILLTGPAGCGKTAVAEQFAARHSLPFLKISVPLVREARDWFGQMRATPETGVYFDESLFAKTVEAGYAVILLDEFNRTYDDSIQNPLLPLFDHSRSVWVEEAGKFLNVGDGLFFFVTANIGSKFSGTRAIDAAFASRMKLRVRCDYLPPAQEADVLTKKTGIDKVNAKKLVNIAQMIRKENATTGTLTETVGTRELLTAADWYTIAGAQTLEYTLINIFNGEDGVKSEAAQVAQMVQAQFGEEFRAPEYLKK
jgi:hypothetical protein